MRYKKLCERLEYRDEEVSGPYVVFGGSSPSEGN